MTIQLYNFWGNIIPLKCFRREFKASRFSINETNQNLWIPNKHLDESGKIKAGENIDYVIVQSHNQIRCSGLFPEFFAQRFERLPLKEIKQILEPHQPIKEEK